MGEYTLKVVEGVYVEKPPEFISHKRANNFMARILGLDYENRLIYSFLKRVQVGRKTYFQKSDFIPGEYYVVSTKYYSSSGNLTKHEEFFLKCMEITDSEVKFETVDEEEVIKGVRFKYPDKKSRIAIEELQRVEARLRPLEDQLHNDVKDYLYYIQSLKKKIEEYKAYIKQAEEEKKKLEEEFNKIKESTKQAFENQVEALKKYSILVAKLFGVKKDYDKQFYEYQGRHKLDDKIITVHIKTQGEDPYYMKVNSQYIFVSDKKPTPSSVNFGFKILGKVIEDNLKLIQMEKPEVPDLDPTKIQEYKEQCYKLLKDRALKLVKAFGRKKDGTYVYTTNYFGTKVEIKASARGVKYLKINDNYIISSYGEQSLSRILYGLKILSGVIREEQKALQEQQSSTN